MSTDTPISMADRRRAARQSSEEQATPEDAATNPEADAPKQAEEKEEAVGINDVVLGYGATLQALQTRHKVPHDKAVRLVELVLQYDIQRRSLALQEAEIMMRNQAPFGVPPGAKPISQEEIDAIQDGTHPDLQEPDPS